jgi:hypothetical protein
MFAWRMLRTAFDALHFGESSDECRSLAHRRFSAARSRGARHQELCGEGVCRSFDVPTA